MNIINLLLGDVSINTYTACIIFALIGIIIRHGIVVKRGVKHSPHTSYKFSLPYWIHHNLYDKITVTLTSILMIFASVRFSIELFNVEVTMFYSFLLGLGFDYLVDKLNKLRKLK